MVGVLGTEDQIVSVFTWRRKERGKAQWGHSSSLGRGNLARLSQAGFPASSQVEYVKVLLVLNSMQCTVDRVVGA